MDGDGDWMDVKCRNILTLEERVRAIREYDRVPVYQKVADIMNCSAKQIRNIIQNRDSILLYYASKTGDCLGNLTKIDDRMNKIDLLNNVMYEWISRTQSREDVGRISTKLIRAIALDVKNHIKIPSFYPNTVWLEGFMQQYNMTEEDLMTHQVYERCTEPKENLSLKISDIVDYVKIMRHNAARSGRTSPGLSESGSKQPYVYSRLKHDRGDDEVEVIDVNEDEDFEEFDEDDDDEAGVPRKVRRLESDDSGNSHSLKFISTYEEALRHLKPLEDFVLLEENFRAIGVISQLEAIFRNPQME